MRKKRLRNDERLYTPLPPSRHIPGVTTMPAVVADFIRVASYDPEGQPDEILEWMGEPVKNDAAGQRYCRELMGFISDKRLLAEYGVDFFFGVFPWFRDRSEERQLYRIRYDDDQDRAEESAGPVPRDGQRAA